MSLYQPPDIEENVFDVNEHGYPPTKPSRSKSNYLVVDLGQWTDRALGLAFNALVTASTEATGYVHGTTLKWGLAREGRLRFNANLRLFSATKGVLSVNGPVVNVIFIISIILSYAASSTVLLHSSILPGFLGGGDQVPTSVIYFLPPIILGTTLILQAILGLIAFFNTHVPTWSSSPLDITSALVHHNYIHHQPQRCMRSVSKTNDTSTDPIRPLSRQPSAWSSHKTVARVVWFVWGAPVIWVGWIFIWMYALPYGLSSGGGVTPLRVVGLGLLRLSGVQSIVTVVLHCCELVTTLARDEAVWRAASTPAGARPAGNPLKAVLRSWQSVVLLLAKPSIHWFFGINVGMGFSTGVQITYLAVFFPIVLFFVAVFITVASTRRPSGPQPVAYGHVQTLADLVDEWSVTMYWGHKEDRVLGQPWPVRHAGTTKDGPLPPIRMEEFYAWRESEVSLLQNA
ncbi:hypothetical protein FRB94_010390 [Tulasnella sp. JGI-2019a]|nr:hypothetical protein FRB94_010390 [Tulasnella sp. JGI-2019a]